MLDVVVLETVVILELHVHEVQALQLRRSADLVHDDGLDVLDREGVLDIHRGRLPCGSLHEDLHHVAGVAVAQVAVVGVAVVGVAVVGVAVVGVAVVVLALFLVVLALFLVADHALLPVTDHALLLVTDLDKNNNSNPY